MKDLRNKVAVVTGGASGIGRAIANRLAAEGMKIVLADVELTALNQAEAEMKAAGVAVIGVQTDVSNHESVENLAQQTIAQFGAVHVVCNNAGVGGPVGPMWKAKLSEWEWTMGVNLWGVVHGIRTFLPILISQNEGHIVNTASMLGMVSEPFTGVYNVTKHAVVTMSETLSAELASTGSAVRVSVLCPNFVQSKIYDYQRNRPAGLEESSEVESAKVPNKDEIRKMIEKGMPASEVAEFVLQAIRDEQPYILTHPTFETLKRFIKRARGIGAALRWSRKFRSTARKQSASRK